MRMKCVILKVDLEINCSCYILEPGNYSHSYYLGAVLEKIVNGLIETKYIYSRHTSSLSPNIRTKATCVSTYTPQMNWSNYDGPKFSLT